jgi:5-(carboxyamino)imidazole ribonucleotide mutase
MKQFSFIKLLVNFAPKIAIKNDMEAKVSIIMGSTSDLPVMEKAAKVLNGFCIPFELNALSAHRTPQQAMDFARGAHSRGIRAIIAGAGGAAHLPGVIAALTPLPVIGVPIKASISIDGWDSILSILQMPPGIPVATVGINAVQNAALLAVEILALTDNELQEQLEKYRSNLKNGVISKDEQLQQLGYRGYLERMG